MRDYLCVQTISYVSPTWLRGVVLYGSIHDQLIRTRMPVWFSEEVDLTFDLTSGNAPYYAYFLISI